VTTSRSDAFSPHKWEDEGVRIQRSDPKYETAVQGAMLARRRCRIFDQGSDEPMIRPTIGAAMSLAQTGTRQGEAEAQMRQPHWLMLGSSNTSTRASEQHIHTTR